MYLKRLYQYHKGWFAFIVLFAASELFICFKRGVVLTPFLQYGMYSGVQMPQDSYQVPEIVVDGKPLQTADFNGQTWDKIEQPLELFQAEQDWNQLIWTSNISRMLHIKDSTPYVNHHTSPAAFMAWYKSYLPTVIHRPVDSLYIHYIIAPWKNH